MPKKTPSYWYKPYCTWQAYIAYPLSVLWRLASFIRRVVRQPITVHNSIIIGNVVAGGAGKTPLIQALRHYAPSGIVVVKPYPKKISSSVMMTNNSSYADSSDEAMLHYDEGDVMVVVKRRDVLRLRPDNRLLLFDDGYQDGSIKATRYILVVDGVSGFGNSQLIPAGPLREPIACAYKRADVIVQIGGATIHAHIKACQDSYGVKPWVHSQPVLCKNFIDTMIMLNKPIIALSGLARNDKFYNSLMACELQKLMLDHLAYPDHYNYKPNDIEYIYNYTVKHDAIIVTTQKDFMRLKTNNKLSAMLHVMPYHIALGDKDYHKIIGTVDE